MKKTYFGVLFLLFSTVINAQSIQQVCKEIDNAAVEFNLPADVLKSIAYNETRFAQIIPDESKPNSNGMPFSYGVKRR